VGVLGPKAVRLRRWRRLAERSNPHNVRARRRFSVTLARKTTSNAMGLSAIPAPRGLSIRPRTRTTRYLRRRAAAGDARAGGADRWSYRDARTCAGSRAAAARDEESTTSFADDAGEERKHPQGYARVPGAARNAGPGRCAGAPRLAQETSRRQGTVADKSRESIPGHPENKNCRGGYTFQSVDRLLQRVDLTRSKAGHAGHRPTRVSCPNATPHLCSATSQVSAEEGAPRLIEKGFLPTKRLSAGQPGSTQSRRG